MANLSSWPEAKVEALAAALKGQAPATGLRGAFGISRSLPQRARGRGAGRHPLAELISPGTVPAAGPGPR
jgi:hypothetical protein